MVINRRNFTIVILHSCIEFVWFLEIRLTIFTILAFIIATVRLRLEGTHFDVLIMRYIYLSLRQRFVRRRTVLFFIFHGQPWKAAMAVVTRVLAHRRRPLQTITEIILRSRSTLFSYNYKYALSRSLSAVERFHTWREVLSEWNYDAEIRLIHVLFFEKSEETDFVYFSCIEFECLLFCSASSQWNNLKTWG